MLNKPTNASPYRKSIDLDDYSVTPLEFSCSTNNSNQVIDARLQINTKSGTYYFENYGGYTIEWTLKSDSDYKIGRELGGDLDPEYYFWDSVIQAYHVFPGWRVRRLPPSFGYTKATYHSNGNYIILNNPDLEDRWKNDKVASLTTSNSLSSYGYALHERSFTGTRLPSSSYIVEKDENSMPLSIDLDNNISFVSNKNTSYNVKTDLFSSYISKLIYNDDDENTILVRDSDYSWQCRLFEESSESNIPNNCLAYGFVNEAKFKDNYLLIKIRPHTNIAFNYGSYYSTIENTEDKSPKEKYYIKIKESFYQIQKYWLSDQIMKPYTTNTEVDSYKEPLYGYALITCNDSINTDDKYTIYCNYTDSDEYYFNIVSHSELNLYQMFNDDANSLSAISETALADNVYSIVVPYSNFQLYGNYSSEVGTLLNRYKITLYKLVGNNLELIDSTPDIIKPYIKYSYDKMVSGEQYRIDIMAVDTKDHKTSKSISINVQYDDIINEDLIVSPAVYREHSSILVDYIEAIQTLKDYDSTDEDYESIKEGSRKFVGVKVYKTIGADKKLHQISDLSTAGSVEDFFVNESTDYTYYIYPEFDIYVKLSKSVTDVICLRQIQSPIITDSISTNETVIKLIGLNVEDYEKDIYSIDLNNIWCFKYNISDGDTTINNDKTFSDTQNRYSKETVGQKNYITKSISGLLGSVDCATNKYIDTYDNIKEWKDFVSGSQPKALVDTRGFVYICDTDANPTFKYEQSMRGACMVSFNVHEIDNIENVTIYQRNVKLLSAILADSGKYLLQSSDSYYLQTNEGDI